MRLQRNTVVSIATRLWRGPGKSSLRRAAIRYARHGWDVVPGAWLEGHRFVCGRPTCRITSCHPAFDEWERLAGHDLNLVSQWWRHRPWAVLLTTGRAFDALEVPADLGDAVTRHDSFPIMGGPVITTPGNRWLFLVQPGGGLSPRLASRPDVVLHGRRSWIPAPPTRDAEDAVRWRVSPGTIGYRLGDPGWIQSIILDNLPPLTPPTPVEPADCEDTPGWTFPPGWEPVPGLEPGASDPSGSEGGPAAAPWSEGKRPESESRNAPRHFERTPRSRLRRSGQLMI